MWLYTPEPEADSVTVATSLQPLISPSPFSSASRSGFSGSDSVESVVAVHTSVYEGDLWVVIQFSKTENEGILGFADIIILNNIKKKFIGRPSLKSVYLVSLNSHAKISNPEPY